jgi:hypothetical protein
VPPRLVSALLAFAIIPAAVAVTPSPVVSHTNTIPIQLHENLAPVLFANIDGMDVPLQFDLGDRSPLMLQQSVLDSIKAAPTGEASHLQGVDGEFKVPTFKIPRVQIGTAVFTDVVARLDASRKGYQPGTVARGFLGTGLFKSYQVVLDYPHGTIALVSLGSETSAGTCTGNVVPFSTRSQKWRGEPVSEVETDWGTETLWWDTGSPATILTKSAIGKARVPVSGDSVNTKRFALGGTDFGPWPFQVWDISLPGFDGFIGHDFFMKHVVCIDFPGNRVVIPR